MIANYVEALTRAAPPRVVALSSMGANRTSGLGMITALSLLEQGFRDLASPIPDREPTTTEAWQSGQPQITLIARTVVADMPWPVFRRAILTP